MELLAYTKSPDPSSLLLSILILLAAYTITLCNMPPNPNPAPSSVDPKTQEQDSVQLAANPSMLSSRRNLIYILGLSHAFICLVYPFSIPAAICPHPENLSPFLFTWNPHTIICLLFILVAGPIRLLAYAQLGKNFTFRLAKPQELVTTGLYAWVQHPSYTTNALVVGASSFLMERRDGIMGCWLPAWFVSGERVAWWMNVAAWIATFGAIWAVGVRVRDEERMLKKTFGKEWEEWHAKTKRFIPGVF